jgi:CRP-like cAMP-binding protein
VLTSEDRKFLGELSVFAGLRGDVMETLGNLGRRLDLTDHQVLFDEGEPANEMLVVLSGRLEVFKRSQNGSEVCIATLGPGDVAGEMSLIDIQPRSAGVRAVGAASVVVLSHGDIATIYREDKPSYTLLVLNIAREISLRLRRLDATLANIMSEIQSVTTSHASRLSPTSSGPAGK